MVALSENWCNVLLKCHFFAAHDNFHRFCSSTYISNRYLLQASQQYELNSNNDNDNNDHFFVFTLAPTLPSDWYRLDVNKSKNESALEIYVELSSPKLSIPRRISLLNAFVTIYDPKREKSKFCSHSELRAVDDITLKR